MYSIDFSAVRGADWAQAIEIIDDTTNLPLDVSDATVRLEIGDRHDRAVLTRSTTDATIERPTPSIIQWSFPADDMTRFCSDATYRVQCFLDTAGGTIALFTGTLSYSN